MVRGRATNNSLSRSRLVNLGSGSQSGFNDFVGLTDRDDVYRVRLGDRSNLNVQLTGIQRGANINIQLFSLKGAKAAILRRIGGINFSNLRPSDIRRNLNRLGQSVRAGRNNENLTRLLDAGEYYLRVFSPVGNSNYRLTLSTTPDSSTPSPTPGGTPTPTPGVTPTPGGTPTPTPGGGTPTPTPVPGGGTPTPTPGSSTPLTPTWIRQLGTTANDYAYGVAVGTDASVLVAGATSGNLQGNNAGGSDNFVVRYDSNGSLPPQLLRQFGTGGEETILDIEVDATGNYYIAGTLTSGSGQNADVSGFVRKFNSAGEPLWAQERRIDTTFSFLGNDVQTADGISSLALDANGNVYIAGFINGIPAGIVPFVSNPARAFVEKLDGSTGNSITGFGTNGRAQFSASSGSAGAAGVAVDNDGNVYITGITNATLTTDANNPFTGGDAFVVKYNGTSGAQVWSQTLTSANNAQDYARGIAIAGSNVYITGLTAGTLPGQTSAGGTDGFLAQYTQSNNGTTVSQGWVRQFGTTTLDESQGIATDSAGNVYITGETNAALFGGNYLGNSDAFVAKYDSTGTRLASSHLGTTQADEAYGIRVDSSGNVYVVGQTQGNLNGNNQGSYDAFVAKYSAF